jgi:biotin transport system substrate-specific component
MLGPVWGGASMLLYLTAGLAGAPVFANGQAGLQPLVGFTAGYLWSYPLAAFLIGVVVHGGLDLGDYDRASTLRLVGAMLAGTVVIYALGTVGFAVVQGVGLVEAFTVSALVFVPFEAVKIAAAVGIVRSDRLSAD